MVLTFGQYLKRINLQIKFTRKRVIFIILFLTIYKHLALLIVCGIDIIIFLFRVIKYIDIHINIDIHTHCLFINIVAYSYHSHIHCH